jgi:hypothetical protein
VAFLLAYGKEMGIPYGNWWEEEFKRIMTVPRSKVAPAIFK